MLIYTEINIATAIS